MTGDMRRLWRTAVGAAVATGAVLSLALWLDRDEPCAVTLRVTTSSEKDGLIEHLAAAYTEQRQPLRGGGCAAVVVTSQTSGVTKNNLIAGAAPPDVWLPSSSMWVKLLDADFTGVSPAEDNPSITQSPVVIAMPKDEAQRIGWPGRSFTWADVLGLSGSQTGGKPFYVGRENPDTSTSGLASTIAAYFAAMSGTDPRAGLDRERLDEPRVQAYVRRVEANILRQSSVVRSDIMNLLESNLDIDRGTDSTIAPVSALVLQEELIHLYNTDNLRAEVSPAHPPRPPRQPLVPIYPTDGTLNLDHPYVVMPGAERDPRTRAAATGFRDFLLGPQAQQVFQQAGFRSNTGTATEPLISTTEVPESARRLLGEGDRPGTGLLVRANPDAATIKAVLANQKRLKKRMNVLVLIDESGSMKGARAEAAKAAAGNSIGLLAPQDRVGLWFFHSLGRPPRHVVRDVIELGEGAGFSGALARMAPAGDKDTALYVSVRDAHATMVRAYRDGEINAVVVLTDGVNDYDADPYSLGRLLRDLRAGDKRRQVPVYCIAFGQDAAGARSALDQIGTATGAGPARNAFDPAAVEQVFGDILRDAGDA